MSAERDGLDDLDYYALLAVERAATPDDIRVAFRTFAQRYHPDLYAGGDAQKVARATAIYQRGTEAYRVLLDATARARYDAQLAYGIRRYQPSLLPPAELARQSIPPALLPKAREAQAALKAGAFDRAVALLREALAQEPNNPVLLQGLAEAEARAKGAPR